MVTSVLAVVVAASIGSASAAGGESVRGCALVLRSRDVAGSFVVRSRRDGVKVFAEDPLATPTTVVLRLGHLGKTDGCRADLVRPVTAVGLQQGPLEIISSASVYRRRAGARSAFAYAARSLVPAIYAPLPVDFRLGDESREWVRQGSSQFGTMLVYFVLWRHRQIDASIVIVGRVGVVSAANVAPLAAAQEARIRHAHLARSPQRR